MKRSKLVTNNILGGLSSVNEKAIKDNTKIYKNQS